MSLSGNLGFVSLDEVLRLLTRSEQQGSVEVSGDDVHGRIFVTKGGIALATTSDDEGMHRHLVKSGLADDSFLSEVEAGDTTLAPIVEKSGGALIDLLREMTVESLYQLGLKGDSFEVSEGKSTLYASPKTFDLENLLGDSKQRLTDWTEVSKTIADLERTLQMNRDLGEREEVSVDNDSWRVLSEIGTGSSVRDIAAELGTTEFWTARVAARLINEDLIRLVKEQPEVVEEPVAYEEPTAYEETSWDETAEEDVDPDESWWTEPEAEEVTEDEVEDTVEEPAAETEPEPEPEPVKETTSIFGAYAPGRDSEPAAEESASQIPTLVEEDETSEVEEDTEAFLEKVFSELDGSEETEEEGYGLLRRRRLGAMRDAASDS